MTVLSTVKPQPNTEVDATALSSNFTAIEAVVNGALDEGNFTSGLLYSPSKLKQGGANTNDILQWNGSAWVPIPIPSSFVSGMILEYAGITAPTGWLMCDGSAQTRATYTSLVAAIFPTLGTFTVTIASPGVFTFNSHGLETGDKVSFSTSGSLPTGLAVETAYYVSNVPNANSFRVTATWTAAGPGADINTSGSQSGTHTLYRCPYGATGSASTFKLPDGMGRSLVGRSPGGSALVKALGLDDGRAANVRSVDHYHGISNAFGGAGGAVFAAGPGDNGSGRSTGDQNNKDYGAFLVMNHIIKT